MVATLAAVAGTAMVLADVSGPGAVILGGGLALSSTAVAMQVLQDRGESGSRHGRATFAVLLLQVQCLCQLCLSLPAYTNAGPLCCASSQTPLDMTLQRLFFLYSI